MESLVPPEIQMKALEMVKNRRRLARGAKELVSYSPIGYQGTVGVWETDSVETLFPMLNALSSVGVDTEIPHWGVRNSDEEMGRRHQ